LRNEEERIEGFTITLYKVQDGKLQLGQLLTQQEILVLDIWFKENQPPLQFLLSQKLGKQQQRKGIKNEKNNEISWNSYSGDISKLGLFGANDCRFISKLI
jgi:hypothetical protein